MSGSVVYFLAVGKEPYTELKIGRASDLKARLTGYRTTNPHGVHVFGTIPGGKKTEKTIHLEFAEFKLKGEWFVLNDDSRALMDLILSEGWENLDKDEPRRRSAFDEPESLDDVSNDTINVLTRAGYPFGNSAKIAAWRAEQFRKIHESQKKFEEWGVPIGTCDAETMDNAEKHIEGMRQHLASLQREAIARGIAIPLSAANE